MTGTALALVPNSPQMGFHHPEPRLKSDYLTLCDVTLPYQGRQLYMAPFEIFDPVLPKGFEDYTDIILTLTEAAQSYAGKAYLTVDERMLQPGETQRRPGPHVDGCFDQSVMDWGHPGGQWLHGCNNVPGRMAVIVASSAPLCEAWRGIYAGEPKSDGDCKHIVGESDGKILDQDKAYLFSPDCIHESLPAPFLMKRTFIRIAMPIGFRSHSLY